MEDPNKQLKAREKSEVSEDICSIKHHVMKMYGGTEVYPTHF
jgi:hypothetical protein